MINLKLKLKTDEKLTELIALLKEEIVSLELNKDKQGIGITGRPKLVLEKEITDFIKNNYFMSSRKLSEIIFKKFNKKIHYNTLLEMRKREET